MHQWTGLLLVQVMACRLFGAKPTTELILLYRYLDSWDHVSVKFEFELYHFHTRKCIQYVVCQNCGHCLGLNVLKQLPWLKLTFHTLLNIAFSRPWLFIVLLRSCEYPRDRYGSLQGRFWIYYDLCLAPCTCTSINYYYYYYQAWFVNCDFHH